MTDPGATTAALARLDEITRRLRVECPWDREQDARSIVAHTVEEAYELADAALAGDDAKLLDELGDVLFQVVFLALLLEERGAGDLASVAEHCRAKLIRRHPHVFGDVEKATRSAAGQGRRDAGQEDPGTGQDAPRRTPLSARQVLANWDEIKAEVEGGGAFGDLPETLPGTLYAKKAQRRVARVDPELRPRGPEQAAAGLAAADTRERRFEAAGDMLFAAVAEAAAAGADPELALRAAADRHISRAQEARPQP
ncbi:MAG: MazG nucleotide pyrophosphohydrolase domain-containing protein [Thermoleophilaceae bacterium]